MNRVCWYGEDTACARPRLLTQTQLPVDAGEDVSRWNIARIMRTSEVVGLRCPGGVAAVVEVVEESGTLWTVVEWIDGMPLGELLDQHGTFDYVRAARIGLDLLDVLEPAHGDGIAHGELSPGQVFVRDHGGVVVTGFGMAGVAPPVLLGAPAYASPEQARGESGGSPADLWALGALLYTMTEGRPPFRDRGRPEATLKAVERLPPRTPRRAGPLAQTVQGLLHKDPRERLTGPVVRDALTRIVSESSEAVHQAVPPPRLSARRFAGGGGGGRKLGRATLIGAAVAAVGLTVTALAATGERPGVDSSLPGPGATASPTGSGVPTGDPSEATTPSPRPADPTTSPSASVSRSASASPSASTPPSASATAALPAGYRVYTAPEGFAVALPKGWKRLSTGRADDLSYRVVFGADGDPRNLTVTFSTRVGPDPVAVWRDDVEPSLQQRSGFDRLGAIRATTYQGHKAADMEWLDQSDGTRVRTFGRGFLIGGGRGFSLRWTTPAAVWNSPGNQQALKTVLETFREPLD
ncbi:serine/threonine-protein kinase [Streptomyces albicerus]|uniref:serine/threonine-protein kinase n=1 Tax=Streptomyces albicerus TaxID=2569859 RepID=UPI00298E07D0|nr:serine/threonine-protein kinase [Streptomyces albicerus]